MAKAELKHSILHVLQLTRHLVFGMHIGKLPPAS